MEAGFKSRAGRSAGLVLAAGESRRLGTPKQLLPMKGLPMLGLVLAKACASELDEVVLVLGAYATRIVREIPLGRARVVVNHAYRSGMSSSLQTGLDALGDDVQRLMVILGDQPDISEVVIDELLKLHAVAGLPAAALSVEGVLQPPVVLDRSLWDEVRALRGDVGCRAVIRDRSEDVVVLPRVRRAGYPTDIDTIGDYQRFSGTAE
jgi:molybdenum cofactor cytidylyltransferase